MKTFIRVLTFTFFSFCFATKFQKYYLNNEEGEKGITIAFVLNGAQPQDANLKSEIGEWLDGVMEQAHMELRRNLSIKITLELTDIVLAPTDISDYILRNRADGGLIHGPTVVQRVKRTYKETLNPDIICLVTRELIYVGYLRDLEGYSEDTTLCEEMVPMLLTYDWDTMDDAPKAGTLLSKLITSSLNYINWRSTSPKEDYFIGCNIRHKLYADDEDYFVLPLNKDDYYTYD